MNPSMGAILPQIPKPAMPGAGAGQPAVDPTEFGDYSDWAKENMAKGISADQLKQTLSQSGIEVQPKSSGNWMTHLLPTIGSVAVPALAGLLAPETGGLSLLAGAALSGAGAMGGKAIENATEGKQVLDKSLLDAGTEGLIGGAVGGAAGKVLGKAAGALGGTAEKLAAKEATEAAATDAIETAANTYKDINPKLQGNLGAKDILKKASDLGYDIGDPKNLTHVATTTNDILNDTLNKALAEAGPVDASTYNQIIKDVLAKESGRLGSFDPVAMARGRFGPANTPAGKLLSELENLGAGVAKSGADPNELRTLTTKLGEMANDAKPIPAASTGAIDPVQKATYNVYSDVRNQLKDLLYKRPELNDIITKLEGNLVPDEAANITPQLAEHINDVITRAGRGTRAGAQDLLSEISNNIDMGTLGREGERVGQIVSSTGAKARAAAEAGINVGEKPKNIIDTAGGIVGGNHGGVVNTAIQGAMHAAQNPAVLETLSRIGSMGAKLAPTAGVVAATAPNWAAGPVAAGGAGGGTMGGTMQDGQVNAIHQPNNMQSLIDALTAQAILAPSVYGSTATPFLTALSPMLQKNRMAESSLEALPEAFANAGGAQGTGGILSRLTGLIPGTAAHTYNNQREAAAQALAQSMGITPGAAAGMLPSVMQNAPSANLSQGILAQLGGNLAY